MKFRNQRQNLKLILRNLTILTILDEYWCVAGYGDRMDENPQIIILNLRVADVSSGCSYGEKLNVSSQRTLALLLFSLIYLTVKSACPVSDLQPPRHRSTVNLIVQGTVQESTKIFLYHTDQARF